MKKIFSIYSLMSENYEAVHRMEALYTLIRVADCCGTIDDIGYQSYCELLNDIKKEMPLKKCDVSCKTIIDAMEWLKYPLDEFMDDDDRKFMNEIFNEDFSESVKTYLSFIYQYRNTKTDMDLKNMLRGELIKDKPGKEVSNKKIEQLYKLYNEQKRQHDYKKDDEVIYVYKRLLGNIPGDKKVSNLCDFIIDKGMLSTPKKNNPYMRVYTRLDVAKEKADELNGDSDVWKIKRQEENEILREYRMGVKKSDVNVFLKHFSLHKISIKAQENIKMIEYVVERITNVNLINKIYSEINNYEKNKTTQFEAENLGIFSLLAMYPLVKFRLKIIEKYICQAKKVKDDNRRRILLIKLIKTVYHQTFVYFPLLNILGEIVDGYDSITVNEYSLFNEVEKNGMFHLESMSKLVKESDDIYPELAASIYRLFAESLTFREDDNIVDRIMGRFKKIRYVQKRTILDTSYYEPIKSINEYLLDGLEKNDELKKFFDGMNIWA